MTDHEYLRELAGRLESAANEEFGGYDAEKLLDIADRLIRMEAANDIMAKALGQARRGQK